MNPPGQSTRQMEQRRKKLRLLLLALGLVVYVILFSINLKAWNIPVSLMVLVGLLYVDRFLNREMDWFIKREKDAARGAEAEETVGAILNRLPADCEVLHDIPAKFGNIDHLVFRKDGAIFLIETKSHGGRIDERRASEFISQTHRNVFWLRDFLKERFGVEPWISAAIVFPNAYVTVRRPLRGVEVINGKYLERWLAKQRGNPRLAKLLPQLQREFRHLTINPMASQARHK